MAESDLKRVSDDLAAMKEAVGVGLPFGREDIRLSLGWAAAGAPVAVCVAFRAVEPWALGLLAGVPTVLMLIATARVSRKYHRQKTRAPTRWREHRHQWVLAGLMVPLFAGFWMWGLSKGLSPDSLAAAAVFMAGLGYLIPPLVDRNRLHYAGWAVPTMLLAIVGPSCGHRYIGVALGGWLILAGLSTAALMLWLLRTTVNDHDTD